MKQLLFFLIVASLTSCYSPKIGQDKYVNAVVIGRNPIKYKQVGKPLNLDEVKIGDTIKIILPKKQSPGNF